MPARILDMEERRSRNTPTNGVHRHNGHATDQKRPLKWNTIFFSLRQVIEMLENGNRPQAIEEIGRAADWSKKWAGRFREETSMGLTIAEAIENSIVHPLSMGATPKQILHAVGVLERVVTREANACAVVRAQAKLRLRFKGRTPEEARERAVAAALRQVASSLEAGNKE